MTKRLFDVAASLLGLVILAPVFAVIAILVKRDTAGPAVFRQDRVGRYGRTFSLLKFRTMVVAPEFAGPLVTAAGDARVTRIGFKLRATKLDELPQLVNVLKGDMSIVGPRPEVPQYVDLWGADDRRIILSVRPGITDPATLRFRREEDLLAAQADPEQFYRLVLLPQKVSLYREYVQSRTLAGDLAVILRTVKGILTR